MHYIGGNYNSLLRNRYVISVAGAQLIRIFGRSQAWIFLPIFLHDYRGVQFFIIGFLFTLTALISIPVSLYGGNLCDRLGRRKVSLIFMPVGIGIFAILFLAVYLSLSTIILYVVLILSEPIFSIQWIVDNAIISDTVPEAMRTDAFSITRIAGNLGFSIGPAVGGILSEFNISYVFLSTVVSGFIELFIYARLRETNRHLSVGKQSFSFPAGDRKFIFLSLLLASIWFVAGQWGTTLTLFWTSIDHVSQANIGFLYSVNGLFVVLLQLPTNRLFTGIKDHVRIFIGSMTYVISFFALALFSGIIFLVIDVFFLTFGENTISPVTNTVISKISPEDRRGEYFGAFYLISGFMVPMAPLMGTYLMQNFAYSPVIFWGIIAIIGTLISLFMLRFGADLIESKASEIRGG
ncbi:MAG: MFS transporter [Candidatus Thermoplasmatota archaeon]|nr:MFS transporter [Candidatus Thermoplasmatota archaeon]